MPLCGQSDCSTHFELPSSHPPNRWCDRARRNRSCGSWRERPRDVAGILCYLEVSLRLDTRYD